MNITFPRLCDSNSDRPEGNKVFNRSKDMSVIRAGDLKTPGLWFLCSHSSQCQRNIRCRFSDFLSFLTPCAFDMRGFENKK